MHLAVGQGVVDRLFEGQIPDLRRLGVAQRQRRQRPADLVQRLDVDVGDLEVGGHALVVGQVAVFNEVEGLLGRASGGHGQPHAQNGLTRGIADSWIHIPVTTRCRHVRPATGATWPTRQIENGFPPVVAALGPQRQRDPRAWAIDRTVIGNLIVRL